MSISPLLFVPGVLGTTLVDTTRDQRCVWGSARALLAARRLPVTCDGIAGLIPGEVLWRFAVVPRLYSVPVYERLAGRLESIGYRRTRLESLPNPRGLYSVAYDWRADIVAAARAVEDAIGRLKARGISRVRVLAHSWGCNVVRYYLRYGGADRLGDRPEPARPGADNVESFYALGPLFGGTLRALHESEHGFPVAAGLGVGAHQAATAPSLYQLLPYAPQNALTSHGDAVVLDLADAATWKHRAWGLYRPSVLARLNGSRRSEPASYEKIESRLSEWLRRARALWTLLEQPHPTDVAVRTVTYTLRDSPTLTRIVIDQHGCPLACPEDVLRRTPALAAAVISPGDGYVSLEQVRRHARAPIVSGATDVLPGSYVLAVEGSTHRDIYKHEAVLTNLLANLSQRKSAPVSRLSA